MTLQLVHISPFGIVCAADSAITFADNGSPRGQKSWPKLLRIDKLKAVIGYYGYSAINGRRLPDWLESFSRRNRASSLSEFTSNLKDKLNSEWVRSAGEEGTGFHLAGYTIVDQITVPCFYHIWNHNDVSGGYKVIGDGFRTMSDFLERDAASYVPRKLDEYFKQHGDQVYRNGALSLYNELAESLYGFARRLFTKGLLLPPSTITDWAWHYRFQLETVKLMYRYLTNKRYPPIGHKITIYTIDATGRIKLLPNQRNKH